MMLAKTMMLAFWRVLTTGKRFLVSKYYARNFFQGISSQKDGLAANREKHQKNPIDRGIITKSTKGEIKRRPISIKGSMHEI
jgi:hypothetical protein